MNGASMYQALGALAWAYIIGGLYTALVMAILVWRARDAAAKEADRLGISTPVFVLGVCLIWPISLAIIINGFFGKDRPRR